MRNAFLTASIFSYLFLVLAFTPKGVRAQTVFAIGPQLGAVASTSSYTGNPAVYASSYLKPTYKVGAEVGIKTVIRLRKVAIQPALLYSQKGFGLTGTYTQPVSGGTLTNNVQEDFHLNYLCLPVSIAYSFHESGQGMQIFAGPYLNTLLGGSVQFDNSTQADTGYQTFYQTTQTIKAGPESQSSGDTYFQRYDFGFQAGVGYAYGNWLLQGSYSLGISNTGVSYPMNVAPYQDGPTYHNRGFSLNVSYLFSENK